MLMAKYQIGKVSELLGIHQQTLRYYDTNELVVPYRDESNGHRIYSIYDIYKVTMRKQYQNLGCTVSETKKILNEYSIREIVQHLTQSEERLKKQILYNKLNWIGLRTFKERIKKIPKYLNRFSFRTRPARWHHIHSKNGQLINNPNTTKARQIAMDLMPLCVYTFKFDYREVENNPQSEQNQWDITIVTPHAEKVEFDSISSSYFIDKETCLYTILKQLETYPIKSSMLQPALDYIKQNNLKLNGNIYGNLILNGLNNQGENERYFEAWLPVETTSNYNPTVLYENNQRN